MSFREVSYLLQVKHWWAGQLGPWSQCHCSVSSSGWSPPWRCLRKAVFSSREGCSVLTGPSDPSASLQPRFLCLCSLWFMLLAGSLVAWDKFWWLFWWKDSFPFWSPMWIHISCCAEQMLNPDNMNQLSGKVASVDLAARPFFCRLPCVLGQDNPPYLLH